MERTTGRYVSSKSVDLGRGHRETRLVGLGVSASESNETKYIYTLYMGRTIGSYVSS